MSNYQTQLPTIEATTPSPKHIAEPNKENYDILRADATSIPFQQLTPNKD